MAKKGGKMAQLINYQMKVTIQDTRVIIGRFMAFDKHMNIVLGDAIEYRKIIPRGKSKRDERDEKRVLGLVVLRGECIVSISVEGPPLNQNKAKKSISVPAGPGVATAVGRGVAMAPGQAPAGLSGPVRGVGGPAPAQMAPMGRAAPSGPPPGFPGMGQPPPPGMGRGFPGLPPGMPPPPGGMMPPPGGMFGPPG
eukprot:CAMPEP_0119122192 /NCGR_PEP_ID=MMETSP1310-20130426/2524_1 /TAXON_ID=464262 /ORGANISM="Genus nov. species nov., Strain RCC2339" /LENGTH=194 /DNA_ID=CAMNT_0007111813 /DNA_START=135 /DNA_END=715 /DNA_ORIENTATION=+